MYTGKGSNNDSDEQNGYHDRGIDNYQEEVEEVQEKGFEPRVQTSEDIFIFKNTELPGIAKTEKIKRLVVSETTRIILTEQNKIYRWRTRMDPEYRLFQVPDAAKDNFLGILSSKDKSSLVRGVYLDSFGYHCVITCENGNNYYLSQRDSKFKLLKELKGVSVKALAFHSTGNETRTGDIIFATENNLISLYRIELQPNGDVVESSVLQFQIYASHQITAIQILRFTQANSKNYVVMVFATLASLFCISGFDDLEVLLAAYRNGEKVKEISMPKGYQCLLHTSHSKTLKRPTNLLWTNGNNLLNFKLPDADQVVSDNLLSRSQPFKFAKRTDMVDSKAYQMQEHPIAIGITDFHYYILFQESITILSTITQRVVLNEEFKGSLVSDMAYERATGIFWIFSNKGVIKLDTSKQGAEAWKLLLQEKRYKEAYTVCKAKGENVSYIAGMYADDLFLAKKYQRAAIYFGETSRTFQEIFLKYLQVNCDQARQGLQIYLKSWLNKLSPTQRSQRCLLVSWLIELMVYRLNNLERFEDKGAEIKQKVKVKQADLENLLETHLGVVNEELVYLIMQSHGRVQNLVSFADKKNNFEMIVMHYLSEESYEKALEYLRNVKDSKVVEVIYKYSHIFFRYETEKTVTLLTKTIRDFKPIKLMAGLMNIPDAKRTHGIQLLRYCVEELKSKEKSLHNILIFFYATSPREKLPELIQMMRKSRLDFDLDFGLRLFKTHKVVEAQIMVYGKMYLYGEAVSLALEHNKEELAKEYADKPEYEDERKKLWIEIAKHFLVKRGKISEVIELTKQSRIVKIEDLLPYFNQNIKIQNFKDEICDSLKSYSQEITRLKKLLDSYSENTEELKHELRLVEKRCMEFDSSHKCEECFKTLFSQEFYIFPCMHGFHRDCLYAAVQLQPTFDRSKIDRIEGLTHQIANLQDQLSRKKADVARSNKEATSGFSLMNALNIWGGKKEQEQAIVAVEKQEAELKSKKEEIDNQLAAECLYCGPGIVDSITMPFDSQYLRDSWKI